MQSHWSPCSLFWLLLPMLFNVVTYLRKARYRLVNHENNYSTGLGDNNKSKVQYGYICILSFGGLVGLVCYNI